MPAIAAAIITALGWSMKYLVGRVLLALGLQMAVVAGLSTVVNSAMSAAVGSLDGLGGTVLVVVQACRVPDALAIVAAAVTVRMTLVALRPMFVSRSAA